MEKAIEIFYKNENEDEITDYESLDNDYDNILDSDLALENQDESAFEHEDL